MKLYYVALFFGFCTLNINLVQSQSITPIKSSNNCQFTVSDVFFEAAADYGGRISSFKIEDNEILFNDKSNGASTWGSVLWPSPQSEWNWPPIETLDSKAYNFEIQGNRCRMTSEISSTIKMSFIKDYYAAIEDTSITIVYKIINESSSTKKNAAWEVTRVPPSGLFFYPTGDASATSGLSEYVNEISGYSWYANQESDNGGQKFFADGSQGWYAHINADGYIFIKQFVDVANDKHAPGENEIELWLNSDKAYMELENQSVYATIPAGDTLKYVLKWYLRKLPDTLTVEAGNLALVDFVEKTISDSVSDPDPGTETGTEIDLTSNLAEMQIWPNPATNYINVNTNSTRLSSVKIYTISGQLLVNETVLNNGNVNISYLKKGLYLVKIETESKIRTRQLVVE
jgi:hypothetical protein